MSIYIIIIILFSKIFIFSFVRLQLKSQAVVAHLAKEKKKKKKLMRSKKDIYNPATDWEARFRKYRRVYIRGTVFSIPSAEICGCVRNENAARDAAKRRLMQRKFWFKEKEMEKERGKKRYTRDEEEIEKLSESYYIHTGEIVNEDCTIIRR